MEQSTSDESSRSQLPPVFLLKTPSTPRDLYEEYFRNNTFAIRQQQQTESSVDDDIADDDLEKVKYDPIFVPVLSHRFHPENSEIVKSYFMPTTAVNKGDGKPLNNAFLGQGKKYGGIIFTSQRAVEAMGHILEHEGIPTKITTSTSKDLILYTVGPATTRTLTPIRDKYLPFATIYGDEAGNGEDLAHLILEHYNSCYPSTAETHSQKPGLLFLVGEQRRDIIPKTLMSEDLDESQQINVDELVVYETTQMEGFETTLQDVVRKGEELVKDVRIPLWTVIFSPTGCNAVLRTLNILDENNNTINDSRRNCRIITIGPTTRDHLITKYSFEPDVVAQKPTPEGIGEGIREYLLAMKL
ncbi:uroporphyrinogen-III synthase (UroS), putative [Talaromyces stipitatus ATCC 10500]|uniref:Uroporphyrinogen-III synthase (UroS), putative n=1 Tax=Talaromyces stipitatus (strain ATCC 10500 / CBS 375.48 / QM 6759 / NRRL 1006) TaxID=441959 RepID=B8MCV8_TALSN|nr:uroporphyrinogen-III synthase (UroS), putative [Talaromyces stipitatus ATCC 10500]EED17484.1 uroporphyrinogen-III synthase (UroS), putative [Talaromyces stipitatus ATCC 10500]